MIGRTAVLLLLWTAAAPAQDKRVLFVSHSAGFRHDSIPVARAALRDAGAASGIEVTASEDLSLIRRESLAAYDAVFFFTSGELALDSGQKADLLDFVRGGKGFGGAHSATDTLYSWPEYGELVGGYFDGHPWTHEARVEVEDAVHPATRGLPAGFRILEEFYQHRAFSRDRVRVLMTLDIRSINLRAAGVNRTDEDFALAWCQPFGEGRSFYTALGHFDGTWRDPRFGSMLSGALRWLTGLDAGSCEPRGGTRTPLPVIRSPEAIAPGAVIELFGDNLTPGATMTADPLEWSGRLAGVSVRINDAIAPLLYASPTQINFQAPWDVADGDAVVSVTLGNRKLASVQAPVRDAAPRILAVSHVEGGVILWVIGLGAVSPAVPAGTPSLLTVLSETRQRPEVSIDGAAAAVTYSGIAPGWVGLYQVNVAASGLAAGPHDYVLRIAGQRTSRRE